jgi:hypothetical protein
MVNVPSGGYATAATWNTGYTQNTVGFSASTSVTSTTTGITASSANTGSGTAFGILPPYITVNYIIKY